MKVLRKPLCTDVTIEAQAGRGEHRIGRHLKGITPFIVGNGDRLDVVFLNYCPDDGKSFVICHSTADCDFLRTRNITNCKRT